MTHKRLKSLYRCRHGCLCIRVHLPAAAYVVGWTSQCNVTPVLVTKPLLRLIHAVSYCCKWKRRRILCRSPRRTVSVPVRQTSNTPGHVSHSVCFTRCSQALQCTGQRVQWSVKVTQTMHAARRPTARQLYPGRCVKYDIAIWNATIYRLACSATIWSLNVTRIRWDKHACI